MKPDPEDLRELGENVTNVASAWAGAPDYLSRGLTAWARQTISRDQPYAVRAALAAASLVVDRYVANRPDLPPKKYIDDMLAAIRRWLDDPSRENFEAVRSSLDVTRNAHAWQRDVDVAPYWILESVDHACLAVWSGVRASYIVPTDFATTAARAITCVLHAMLDMGEPEEAAVAKIVTVVRDPAG